MSRFHATASANFNEIEKSVKKFEIENLNLNVGNLVGEGSSAIIYKHVLCGKMVAVKKFRQQLSRKSLLKAVQMLTKLKNEHVVRLSGYSLNPAALVYEFCEVQVEKDNQITLLHSLKDVITIFNDFDYFDLQERISYCIQAAHGINYLHSLGIVHKDIKPSNILVTGKIESMVIKVADFNEVASFKDTFVTATTFSSNLKGIYLYFILIRVFMLYIQQEKKVNRELHCGIP